MSPSTGGFPGVLRAVARVAVVAGAVGAVGLMLRAGRGTPRLLLAIFVVWVLAPFVVLGWAHLASKRWSAFTQVTLYVVTLVTTLGSLACYADMIPRPPGSAAAFLFVIVPPASVLLLAVAVPIAALWGPNLTRR